MKKFFKSFFINQRFFIAYFGVVLLFVLSYFRPALFPIAQLVLVLLLLITLLDGFFLYSKKTPIKAKRILPDKFSNGDENEIYITLKNHHKFSLHLKIIDELPPQFQIRDFDIKLKLNSEETKQVSYSLRPVTRGEYKFGALNVFTNTPIGLLSRRIQFDENKSVPTYPSFLQFKKYDFLAFSKTHQPFGLKKIRKLGDTMEFEQIKEYVIGDNVRNINWKATAKKASLMINQFQDEKSQPIYCVIDKGRVMKMPFSGLSLLDYSINAALVLSNIVLRKHDKAGIFTFSRKLEDKVKAARRNMQMQLILNTLYNIETDFSESDFSRLFLDIKHTLKQRSLLLLFTNFETRDALERQLKYLRALNKSHLLVVIFFENTELTAFIKKPAKTTQEIFDKVIAEKFIHEKKLIVNELKKHGIISILTAPEDLTVNAINKYLEIKSRGIF